MTSFPQGTPARFPATRSSVLVRLREGDDAEQAAAFEALAAAYWQPVCSYLRVVYRQNQEEAEDLTQGFFGAAWAKKFFSRYDPARSRFRTFLRLCLDRFAARQYQAERALKRGGAAEVFSLDAQPTDLSDQASLIDPVDHEVIFHREFVRALFTRSVDLLRGELEGRGKAAAFALFERYDLSSTEDTSYASLAAEFGLSTTTVTNQLHVARRRFREIVLDELRELSGTEEEFRADAASILGIRFS
ncbi:MAG: RNA polymerase sigma factor [Gemmatimonadales bacterium]